MRLINILWSLWSGMILSQIQIGLAFKNYKNLNLLHVLLKGHLFSQNKGVTRIFGDYSFADNGVDIESVGNTTIIPNNVIKDIKKI